LDAAARPPDLDSQMIAVMARVLQLSERVAARDLSVAAEVSALAALLGESSLQEGRK
jgi:hypothetical protein